MHGDYPRRSEPLPPARTRWPDPEPAAGTPPGSFLAPVRSGVAGRARIVPDESPEPAASPPPEPAGHGPDSDLPMTPDLAWPEPAEDTPETDLPMTRALAWPEPAAEDEHAADPSGQADEAVADEADSAPHWAARDDRGMDDSETDAIRASWDSAEGANWDDDDEDAGIVLEADDGDGIELVFDSDAAGFTLAFDNDDDEAETRLEADDGQSPDLPVASDSAEERPAPLSVWGLSDQERARRAREEWDSLGQSLLQSVNVDPPPSVASEAGRTADEGHGEGVEGLEPIGAGLAAEYPLRSDPVDRIVGEAVPQELEELAHRLEQFAAALRSDGTRAMSVAQSRGDPVDAFLAGLAAGYLGGRRE